LSQVQLAVSVAAGLGSAFAFGAASAVQHAESGKVEIRGSLNPGLLVALARRPWWLLGIAADVLAITLQAVALRYGPVSLVQPLLVAGLPVAVALSCLLALRPPRRSEVVGILLCSAGLCAIAPAAAADAGLGSPPGRVESFVAAGILVGVTLLLLALARRWRATAGVATGAAAGLVTGAGSVLLAVCAARADIPLRLLASVAPYLTVAVALLALLLTQAAFQTGSLGAPLAALSIVEPAVAVVLATTVLHERLPTSTPAMVAGLLGIPLAVAGVLVLARSQARRLPLPDDTPEVERRPLR
jgi:uncharacterized membrane protein